MKKLMSALLAALILLTGTAMAEQEWYFCRNGVDWGMPSAEVMFIVPGEKEEGLLELDHEKVAALNVTGVIEYGYDAVNSYVFVDDVLRGLVNDFILDEAEAADVLAQLTGEFGEPVTEGERLYEVMNQLAPDVHGPDVFAQANCWERPDGTLIYFTSYSDDQYVIFWMDYADMAAVLFPAAE